MVQPLSAKEVEDQIRAHLDTTFGDIHHDLKSRPGKLHMNDFSTVAKFGQLLKPRGKNSTTEGQYRTLFESPIIELTIP